MSYSRERERERVTNKRTPAAKQSKTRKINICIWWRIWGSQRCEFCDCISGRRASWSQGLINTLLSIQKTWFASPSSQSRSGVNPGVCRLSTGEEKWWEPLEIISSDYAVQIWGSSSYFSVIAKLNSAENIPFGPSVAWRSRGSQSNRTANANENLVEE